MMSFKQPRIEETASANSEHWDFARNKAEAEKLSLTYNDNLATFRLHSFINRLDVAWDSRNYRYSATAPYNQSNDGFRAMVREMFRRASILVKEPPKPVTYKQTTWYDL